MLIVDAQIHLWEKGTPSPPHRQELDLAYNHGCKSVQ